MCTFIILFLACCLLPCNFAFKNTNPYHFISRPNRLHRNKKSHPFPELIVHNIKEPDLEFEVSISNITPNVLSSVESNTNSILEQPALWRGCILLITIIWATNFALIKQIYQSVPSLDPPVYSIVRFSGAAILLSPFALRKIENAELAISCMAVGAVRALAYVGQSIGLETSTADKAAFICTLQIVWVALVSGLINKKFKLQTWVSVLLSLVGTALLELHGGSAPVVGDLWLLLQPLGFGSGYLLLENLIKKNPDDLQAISAFQLIGVALSMLVWGVLTGYSIEDVKPIFDSPFAMGCFAYAIVVTTAGCLLLQTIAFKR